MNSDYYDTSLRTQKRWKKNYQRSIENASNAIVTMLESLHTTDSGTVDPIASQKAAASLAADFIRDVCGNFKKIEETNNADEIFEECVLPNLQETIQEATKKKVAFPSLDETYNEIEEAGALIDLGFDYEDLSQEVAFLREDAKFLCNNYGLFGSGDAAAACIIALAKTTKETLKTKPPLDAYRTAIHFLIGMTYSVPVERASVTPPEKMFFTPRIAAAGNEMTQAVLGLNEAFKRNGTYMCGLASTIGTVLGEAAFRTQKCRGLAHRNREASATLDAFLAKGSLFLEKEGQKRTGANASLSSYESYIVMAETKSPQLNSKDFLSQPYTPNAFPRVESMLLGKTIERIQERYNLRFWEPAEAALYSANEIASIVETKKTSHAAVKLIMTSAAAAAHVVPLKPETVFPKVPESLYRKMMKRQRRARLSIGTNQHWKKILTL